MLFKPNHPDIFNEDVCSNCGEETYNYKYEKLKSDIWYHKDESGTRANSGCQKLLEKLLEKYEDYDYEDFNFMKELKSL